MAEVNKEILRQSTLNAVNQMKGENQSAQDFVDNLKAEVRAGRATAQLIDLTNLIVATYQEETILKSGMNEFAQMFIEKADDGNGSRFIKHYGKPPRDMDGKFIPDKLTVAKFDVEFVKFKEDNDQLAVGSEKKMWDMTYMKSDLITYFLTGQLSTFIEKQLLSQIDDAPIPYFYDKVMKALVDTAGKGKTINGVETNLFDCLTMELFPAIEDMKQNSSDYNVDPTLDAAIDASHKDNLVMIVSPKVQTMLNSHIMSQLFNSKKIDVYNYVGHVHVPNRKFDFGQDTIVTTADNYIDDDTIIVLDKKWFFKVVTMLSVKGSQEFVNNMSTLSVLHVWTAQKHIKWGKVLTYKNANLTTSPSNP